MMLGNTSPARANSMRITFLISHFSDSNYNGSKPG